MFCLQERKRDKNITFKKMVTMKAKNEGKLNPMPRGQKLITFSDPSASYFSFMGSTKSLAMLFLFL